MERRPVVPRDQVHNEELVAQAARTLLTTPETGATTFLLQTIGITKSTLDLWQIPKYLRLDQASVVRPSQRVDPRARQSPNRLSSHRVQP